MESLARRLALAFVAAAVAVVAIRGACLETIPIDGAYYVAKAQSLGRLEGLRVPWGTGVDAKFFPGLSLLMALPLRLLGLPWGWILVEAASLGAAAYLTARLGRRLGLGAVGCAAAAALFAVDPLVVKWASVPYSEIPALTFALAAIEFAFVASESTRRAAREVAAALALGIAATMRVEALIALPILGLIALRGRAPVRGLLSAAALGLAALLPLGAHVAVMSTQGVDLGRIHYVQEFIANFRWAKYRENVSSFAFELARAVPPKPHYLAAMPVSVVSAQAAARPIVALVSLVGIAFALLGTKRIAAGLALANLLLYPIIHGLWHYNDARFLIIVWPLQAIFFGSGVEALLTALPLVLARGVIRRGNQAQEIVAALLLVVVPACCAALLACGERTAAIHAGEWVNATQGPALEFERKLGEAVAPGATGYFEIGGPMLAMSRRGPVKFTFPIKDFFEADLPPSAVAAQLERGNAFVVTGEKPDTWREKYVPDPAKRPRFVAVLEEPRRTVLVYRAP